LRADAAAPAAPVGAHARARVRATMCTAVSRSTFDLACFLHLIDIPCCPGWTSTLRRGLGGARYSFDLARDAGRLATLGTGGRQVRSHPAPGKTHVSNPQVGCTASLRREPLSPPSLRAQVSIPLGEIVGALESRCTSAARAPAQARLPRAQKGRLGGRS